MDIINIKGINRNVTANLNEYDTNGKDNSQKSNTDNKKSDSVIKTDKIQISSEAKNLNIIDFAKNVIKSELHREISADKINKLRTQIKSGVYKIDAAMIADSVLAGSDI